MPRIVFREEMESIIYKLPNYLDKYLFLSIYEGIKGKEYCEVVQANINNISGNEMKLSTGRIVQISDLLKDIMNKCCKEEKYHHIKRNEYTWYLNENNGDIYRRFEIGQGETEQSVRDAFRVYKLVERNISYFHLDMTISSLYDSGKLNYIITKAKEHQATPEEYLYISKYYNDEVKKQYGDIFNKKAYLEKYKEYL